MPEKAKKTDQRELEEATNAQRGPKNGPTGTSGCN